MRKKNKKVSSSKSSTKKKWKPYLTMEEFMICLKEDPDYITRTKERYTHLNQIR